MKKLPLKLIFIFASMCCSNSGLSSAKSVKLDIKNMAGSHISVVQPDLYEQYEVNSAAEVKVRSKHGDLFREKRNLQTVDTGRGKKKKKIKGVLFLMMVAMAVKCIMVLKALTIKALLASKIALVLSLLSIMKKLFEKPEHKPQTNIVLKREPEHVHYARNDYVGSLEDSDNWMVYPPHERQGMKRRRIPVAKGVFENWKGRYETPRGMTSEDDEIDYKLNSKYKLDPPYKCGKGYLLGSLERSKGDVDDEASGYENKINYEILNTRKVTNEKNAKLSKYNLEGSMFPYAQTVDKNPHNDNSNTDGRYWRFLNRLKLNEPYASRETNINKGFIKHYDNDVFKGTNWAGLEQSQRNTNANNGFENGRSTEVFANWDAYKEFFNRLRSSETDRERPSVMPGSEITNRPHLYNHRS